MDRDRWARIRSIVDGAQALDPSRRQGALAAACNGDAELLDAVRGLLEAIDTADSNGFLAHPLSESLRPVLAEAVEDWDATDVPLEALRHELADRYEVEREVGRGGTAIVYLARDLRHGRPVALKVLRPDLRVRLHPERFLKEIRLTAGLAHPYILPVHDSGSAAGLLFYVMPFVEGRTLRHRLRDQGPLPADAAIEVLGGLLKALAHAHARGIVHCDLKPENVLLLDGHAVLADFGIARAILQAAEEAVDAPGTGADAGAGPPWTGPVGTPPYMSPEQRVGGPVDARSDLHALGVLGREMLGQPLVGREPGLEHPPGADAAISAELDRLLRRLADPDPAKRLASADDASAALRALAPRARKRTPTTRVAAAAALAMFVGAAFWTLRPVPNAGDPASTLAVLPFRNLGPDGDDHLGDGFSTELTAALAELEGIRVQGRTSARGRGSGALSAAALGRSVGAAAVVDGDVQRIGGRVQVTVRLVDVATSAPVWSERYERDSDALIEVHQDIARAVAQTLRPTRRVALRPTAQVDPGAYEAYLKGRYVLTTRLGRESLHQAIEHFGEAVARSPDFGRAWAGLANAHTLLGSLGYAPPRPHFEAARAASDRALALDSLLAEAHEARAHLLTLDAYSALEAERAFRQALELDPGYTQARVAYAVTLLALGRHDEALQQLDTARVYDMLAPAVPAVRGRVLVSAGQPDSAIVALESALELNPNLDVAHQQLGFAHLARGDVEQALTSMRRAAALSGARDSAQLAYILAATGFRAEAEGIVQSLAARPESHDILPFHLALAYTGLAMPDSAWSWLERGVEGRASFMAGVAVTAAFAPLHADPRWPALLAALGL